MSQQSMSPQTFVAANSKNVRPVNHRRGFLKRMGAGLFGILGLGVAEAHAAPIEAAPQAPMQLSADPIMGAISLFAGNFAPRGWLYCHGQLLPIQQYSALFSILGTTYGGDGQTTFALPDLRGRAPIGVGHGPGLTDRTLGEQGGTENVTLTVNQIPAHTHGVANTVVRGSGSQINGAANGGTGSGATQTTGVGGSQPHDNMPPYLGINFVIAVEGIYPSRP